MRLWETSIFFQKNRYRHFYCCPYLPLCERIDPVSRSLLKFKRGAQPDLDNWIDRTLLGFRETPVPLAPGTIIIRALRHQETSPLATPPSSLDRLGHTLSGELGLTYLPQLLYKVRPTPLNQSLSRQQRMIQQQNIYHVDPSALTLLHQATALTAQAPEPEHFPVMAISQIAEPQAIPNPAKVIQTADPATATQTGASPAVPHPGTLTQTAESPAATELNSSAIENAPARIIPSAQNVSTQILPPVQNASDQTTPSNPFPTSLLLLDDILTTGATVLSILQALHTSFPRCHVTIFTLAKTH